MPTEAEIEAAARAVASVRSGMANWRLYVKTVTVALEAAERVRIKPECLEPNEE